ncbi:D-glucuronyl C5-epimerase family protein [Deinococcus radiophilus]|uniref:D-glucuronyl C5-epimerase family protein n=1 Tax=Deinococcus radiophilus TaxID=32062 RepID=UPI00361665DE
MAEAQAQYHDQKRNPVRNATPGGYTHVGDYLNYGSTVRPRESATVTLDDQGVAMVKYTADPEKPRYNPTTISQFGLGHYGRWLRSSSPDDLRLFLVHADRLLLMQDERGALTYDYPWRYYLTKETFQPGWVSGMGQGQAISVWVRAYTATDDQRYLRAAERAYDFMLTPAERGGPYTDLGGLNPEWSHLPFIQEYISNPSAYTLNGYLFSLLGMYDLSRTAENPVRRLTIARELQRHLDSVEKLLPLYDMGGFTSYDLGHLVSWRQGQAPMWASATMQPISTCSRR